MHSDLFVGSYSPPFSLFNLSIYYMYKDSEQWSMSNFLTLRTVWVSNLVFRDTTVNLKNSTCDRYAPFALILLQWSPPTVCFRRLQL